MAELLMRNGKSVLALMYQSRYFWKLANHCHRCCRLSTYSIKTLSKLSLLSKHVSLVSLLLQLPHFIFLSPSSSSTLLLLDHWFRKGNMAFRNVSAEFCMNCNILDTIFHFLTAVSDTLLRVYIRNVQTSRL